MQMEILRGLEWLQEVPQADLDILAYAITPVAIPAGTVLCHAGNPCTGMLLLRSGTATLLRPCPSPLQTIRKLNSKDDAALSTSVNARGGEWGERGGREATPKWLPVPLKMMEEVGTRRRGEVVGEQSLLHGGVHPLTAVADSDAKAYFLALAVRTSSCLF
jgi:CRP-like cAMP-binding protein